MKKVEYKSMEEQNEENIIINIQALERCLDMHRKNRMWIFDEESEKLAVGGIVFIGDSIIEKFPFSKILREIEIINRGIIGDKIGGWRHKGILDRLPQCIYNIKPKDLFIMIGINDILYNQTPFEEIKKGYEKIFRSLNKNLKKTKIHIHSILPVAMPYAKYNGDILYVNKIIKTIAPKYGIEYINLYPHFCGTNRELIRELTNDGLHLNLRGYEIWANIIKPVLESTI